MTFQDDNGNQLEFKGEFAMTKQAVSFFNGAIRGDFSINFSVDNNSVNRSVLNYYGPQMTGQVAWTKQPFNRIRNGNIIDRGYIVIQNDDNGKLNCFYVSGNSNWVQLIQGLITDLDYTGLTNGVNYVTTWSFSATPTTSGVVFPFVDFAYDLKKGYEDYFDVAIYDITLTTQLTDFYPAFYLHTLVQEIVKQNGLKIDGNLLDDGLYKSIVIPSCKGELKGDSYKLVSVTGSGVTGAAGVYAQITAFTELADADNLFSGSSYVSNKAETLVFTVTPTSINIATIGVDLVLYKNGVLSSSLASFDLVGNRYTFSLNVALGDVLTFYAAAPAAARIIAFSLRMESKSSLRTGDVISPSYFLPSVKSLDIIKFVINYFGCSVYFNEYSKTITCNIIEKIQTETALDWSPYFVSVRSEYTVDQAANNYLRLASSDESEIKNYNSTHSLKFGEGNIETPNTLKDSKDLYKLPFAGASFGLSKNGIYQTNLPLINLVSEGEAIPFTVITDLGSGDVEFTVPDGTLLGEGGAVEVVSITNSSGASLGYFTVYTLIVYGVGDTRIVVHFPFYGTDTGKIYRQKINYLETPPQMLTVRPETLLSSFSSYSSISMNSNNYTNVNYAIFTKAKINDTIDQWPNNLSIDNPDLLGYVDPTVKQLYFNRISKFLQNPNIRARLTLPESVYQSFVFDRFIYLKTKNLTGYFFVDSIVNYVDANTPVEVNLYML